GVLSRPLLRRRWYRHRGQPFGLRGGWRRCPFTNGPIGSKESRSFRPQILRAAQSRRAEHPIAQCRCHSHGPTLRDRSFNPQIYNKRHPRELLAPGKNDPIPRRKGRICIPLGNGSRCSGGISRVQSLRSPRAIRAPESYKRDPGARSKLDAFRYRCHLLGHRRRSSHQRKRPTSSSSTSGWRTLLVRLRRRNPASDDARWSRFQPSHDHHDIAPAWRSRSWITWTSPNNVLPNQGQATRPVWSRGNLQLSRLTTSNASFRGELSRASHRTQARARNIQERLQHQDNQSFARHHLPRLRDC